MGPTAPLTALKHPYGHPVLGMRAFCLSVCARPLRNRHCKLYLLMQVHFFRLQLSLALLGLFG